MLFSHGVFVEPALAKCSAMFYFNSQIK